MSFQNEIKKQQVELELEYYHKAPRGADGALDLTTRTSDCGTITREYDSMVVGGCDVSLLSDDELLRTVRDRSWWYSSGYLYLVANGTRQLIYTGRATVPQVEGLTISQPLADPWEELSRIKPGADRDDDDPIIVRGNPCDVIWTLLIDHAGWADIRSEVNPRIDYVSWTAARDNCNTLRLDISVAMSGSRDLRELIEDIGKYCGMSICPDLLHRLKFRRPVPGMDDSPVHPIGPAEIIDLDVEIDDSDLCNDVTVWYGHNMTGDTWAGSISRCDPGAVSVVGRADQKIQDDDVWHNTAASADVLAGNIKFIHSWPVETVSITLPLSGILIDPGDIVEITDPELGYEDWRARVLSVHADIARGRVNLDCRDLSVEPDWYWSGVYTADGLPDEQGWARMDFGESDSWSWGTDIYTACAGYGCWVTSMVDKTSEWIACSGRKSLHCEFPGKIIASHYHSDHAIKIWSYCYIDQYDASRQKISSAGVVEVSCVGGYYMGYKEWAGVSDITLHPDTRYIRCRILIQAQGAAGGHCWIYNPRIDFDPPMARLEVIDDNGYLELHAPASYRLMDQTGSNSKGNTLEVKWRQVEANPSNPLCLAIADGTRRAVYKCTDIQGADVIIRLVMQAEIATVYITGADGSVSQEAVGTDPAGDAYYEWGYLSNTGDAACMVDYAKYRQAAANDPAEDDSRTSIGSDASIPPPAVSNLELSDEGPYISVSFAEPAYSLPVEYEVLRKVGYAGDYAKITSTSRSPVTIPSEGGLNYVRVVTVCDLTHLDSGEESPEVSLEVIPAAEPPVYDSNVSRLLVHFDGSLNNVSNQAPVLANEITFSDRAWQGKGIRIGDESMLAYRMVVPFAGRKTLKVIPDSAIIDLVEDQVIWSSVRPCMRVYIDAASGSLTYYAMGADRCRIDISDWTAGSLHTVSCQWITDTDSYILVADDQYSEA